MKKRETVAPNAEPLVRDGDPVKPPAVVPAPLLEGEIVDPGSVPMKAEDGRIDLAPKLAQHQDTLIHNVIVSGDPHAAANLFRTLAEYGARQPVKTSKSMGMLLIIDDADKD